MAKKNVPEMVDEICEEFCDHYCKWPDKCMEEVMGKHEAETPDELDLVVLAEDMLLKQICAECPMNRL